MPSTAVAPAAIEAFWPVRGSALVIAIVTCATTTIGIVTLVRRLPDAQLLRLVLAHGPAIVGIPAAALLSLTIVAVARCIGGGAMIQVMGLRAEGATATLLLWIAAFLACVLAIRALW
ncbi:hypothetical protein [Sphingomonas kyeonggiensis]|uniref:Uncharacterized protein n=1 Tax=Sphingomonas kyeonggiensis TaxID=1268553 RepID=A0A7W6NVN6_9SPHN|nr:hypothetical protein [Sphingomonas kyeonggiensis]MBB4096816.1 hypothetical protein [Sphingomonas kyeonggiensis]